jgi:hypothetical protein
VVGSEKAIREHLEAFGNVTGDAGAIRKMQLSNKNYPSQKHQQQPPNKSLKSRKAA